MSTAQPPPGYQPQPTRPIQPESPFPPIRQKPWYKRWWAILLFVIVGLLALGGLMNADETPTSTTAVPAPTVTVTATKTVEAAPDGREPTVAPEPEPEPTKAPAAFNPKPKDFTVGIKVLRKECFGSAGCNITYRIVPDYKGSAPIPTDAVIDVTYEVSGAEDPIVGTFTVEDAKAQYNEEESAGTTSSAKKLTAKVTEVSVQ